MRLDHLLAVLWTLLFFVSKCLAQTNQTNQTCQTPRKRQRLVEYSYGFVLEYYDGCYEYEPLNASPLNDTFFQEPSDEDQVINTTAPNTTLGCKDRYMLAHEDSFRPHCEKYVANFEYTLPQGSYIPELARFWVVNNPQFVQIDSEHSLKIIYDYKTFGCPLQPYQEDDFFPDLRIMTPDLGQDTSRGKKFNRSYVMFEIFGAGGHSIAEGYNFTWKNGDTYKDGGGPDCKGPSQNFTTMLNVWLEQRKGSFITGESGITTLREIWNRVNYRSCNSTTGEFDRKAEYGIMNNHVCNHNTDDCKGKSVNKLAWSLKSRPRLFCFIVAAVEDDGTFCDYSTLFAVALPPIDELNDGVSFSVFLCFTLLWIILIVCGYFWRKSVLRNQYIEEARADKLKQAAWSVIYRYEKLLHENEHQDLEAEMTEYNAMMASAIADDKAKEGKGQTQTQPSSKNSATKKAKDSKSQTQNQNQPSSKKTATKNTQKTSKKTK